MAIRSGSPGLKYPLPANTIAQQSAAAASAGGSASASAYGANRSYAANKMRVQADLANSAAERDFRARSQMEEQGFRARENFYDREHQAGAQLQSQEFRAQQEELDRNFRAYQQQAGQNFQLNRDKAEMDFTRERDQAQFDREQAAFETQRDAGIEEGIRTGKLELTPEAQNELNKIEAGRVEAQKLDPAGQADYERQAQERTRKILRTARPPRGPTPDQAWNQNTVHVDAQGRAYPEPIEGKTTPYDAQTGKPRIEQPDTSKQDAEVQRWTDKKAEDLMELTDADGKPKYTPDQAFAEARKQADVWFKARNPAPAGQQPAPAGQQPAPEQPPPVPPPVPQNPLDVPPLPQTPNSGAGIAPRQLGGAGPYNTWAGPQQLDQMPRPMSAEEYAQIPPGMQYLDQQGNLRRKK